MSKKKWMTSYGSKCVVNVNTFGGHVNWSLNGRKSIHMHLNYQSSYPLTQQLYLWEGNLYYTRVCIVMGSLKTT